MPECAPEEKLDILVVDDSPTYRMILSRTIKGCAFANLVGSAADGEAALAAIAEKHPNLVLLDVSMPVLDGIETLKRIRAKWSDVDVIMCSGIDQNQTGLTMQALSLGALDFVPKPQGENPADSFATLTASLHPLLELAFARRHRRSARMAPVKQPAQIPPSSFRSHLSEPPPPKPISPPPSAKGEWTSPFRQERIPPPAIRSASPPHPTIPAKDPGRRPPGHIDLVAVGVSTGGPNALQAMIPKIPANFPVPIVCVQHMPPMFTTSLAERLDRESAIHVQEGRDGMEIQAGNMYIAPGGFHMTVARSGDGRLRLKTNEAPPVNSCRPSVDVMFDAIAGSGVSGIVTVILTGMGSDGAAGVKSLREKGAWSIVQDEPTSVVWGMPGTVATQGQADEILPLERIAPRLAELLSRTGGRP